MATVELIERASDAAVALASAFSCMDREDDGGQEEDIVEDDDDMENSEPVFLREERLQPLRQELQVLWNRYGRNSRVSFETDQMLERLERFERLSVKAVENNILTKFEHGGALWKLDRLAKVLQQHLLNSLRVQRSFIHS